MKKPSSRSLALSLMTACALSGCVHAYPPNERDAILRTAPLEQVGGGGERGELMLLPEGHWALIEKENIAREDRPAPGTLLTMASNAQGDLESTPDNHLFVVLTSRDWGMYLARIDHQPIAPQIPMASTSLEAKPKNKALLERHNACIIDGALADNACIQALPENTRLDIYPLDKNGRVILESKLEDDIYALPARPSGYLHKEKSAVRFIGPNGTLPERALAIALPDAQRMPARPNIAHTPSCKEQLAELAPHANLISATLEQQALANAHILELEQLAMELGADAFVHCGQEDTTTIAAPQIGREWMRSRKDFDLGPAVLGASALEFKRISGDNVRAIAMAMGLMARGDSQAASAWIARTTRSDYSRELDTFVVRSSQLLAHGGYPEQALRAAHAATRDNWNRSEHLAYALTLSIIWSAIGQERERIVQEGKLAEQVSRARESSLQAWTFWRNASLAMIAGEMSSQTQVDAIGEEADDRGKQGDAFRKWKLALHASHLLQTAGDGRDAGFERKLLASATELKLGALFEVILLGTQDGKPLEFSSKPCPLDVYGRCLGASKAEPDALLVELRQLSRAPLRPWFYLESLAPEDARLALAVGLFQRPAGKQKSAIFSHVGSALADEASRASICSRRDLFEAMGRGFTARMQPLEQTATELEWLASEVLPAACEDWFVAAKVVAEGQRDRRLYGLILLENMLGKAPVERAKSLEVLARLGSQRASTAQCQRYNLAYALAMLDSGLIERANEAALAGLNCRHQGPPKHERDAHVTIALIAYEQYGKIPSSFPRELVEELDRLPADERYAWCPGLSHSAPNFAGLLDATILSLSHGARATRVKDAGGQEDVDLRVMRASEAAQLARDGITNAWRELGQPGGYTKSAAMLANARDTAARANAPEVTRQINYIEKHLFQGSFEKIIEASAATTSTTPEKPKGKKARKLTATEQLMERIMAGEADAVRKELEGAMVEGAKELLYALTLLSGDITDLERVTKQHGKGAASVPELCSPRVEVF